MTTKRTKRPVSVAVGNHRLLKLAAFLDTLPKQKFDFCQVATQPEGAKPMLEALKAGKHACGTVGCALGWSPVVFPRLLEWVPRRNTWNGSTLYTVCERERPKNLDTFHTWETTQATAERVFGLSNGEVLHLFQPDNSEESGGSLPEDATPKQVARHIRAFVRTRARQAAA